MDITVLADLGRWATIALFALFAGGAVLVHVHYRRKNARWRKLSGNNRPMFRHVMYVSLGTVLAAFSAVTNTVERLGDGFTFYVPLNLLAFLFLWSAMLAMLRDAETNAEERQSTVEQVIGNKITEG